MYDSNRAAYVANETTSVVFSCSFYADPQPSVEWLHHGNPIPTQQTDQYRTTNFTNTPPIGYTYSQLTLLSVVEEDSGNYACRGRNRYGEEEVLQTLAVLGQFMHTYDLCTATYVGWQ